MRRLPALTVGSWLTVKVAALVALPPGVVIEIVPVVPELITATKAEPLLEIIELTAVPPIVTLVAVAPAKFVPNMVIEVPTQPLEVPKLVIVGGSCRLRVNNIAPFRLIPDRVAVPFPVIPVVDLIAQAPPTDVAKPVLVVMSYNSVRAAVEVVAQFE